MKSSGFASLALGLSAIGESITVLSPGKDGYCFAGNVCSVTEALSLLEQFTIRGATHIFRQNLESGGSFRFHQMYSLDLRPDVSSYRLGIIVDDLARSHHSVILKRQCTQVRQHVETFSLSDESCRRIEQSRLYFSGPKSN